VTALIQASLSGIALWATGVPFAALLAALALLLTIVQIGPAPILIGATIWLYYSGAHMPAIVLLVCTAVIVSLDNIIRPIMIRRGVDLPMLLILSGVIGGLVAFGMIGLFIGPVLLAITYTLINAWIDDDPAVKSLSSETAEK
jgi:predicted PurR-regulated permease PerM